MRSIGSYRKASDGTSRISSSTAFASVITQGSTLRIERRKQEESMKTPKHSPQSGQMESQEDYQFDLPKDMVKVMVQAYAQAFTDAVGAYRHQQPSVEGAQLEQQASNALEKLKAMVRGKPLTNDLNLLARILVRTYVSAYHKESHLFAEVPSYAERWRHLLSGGNKESMKAAVLAAAAGAIGMLDVTNIDWDNGPQWSLPQNDKPPALAPPTE